MLEMCFQSIVVQSERLRFVLRKRLGICFPSLRGQVRSSTHLMVSALIRRKDLRRLPTIPRDDLQLWPGFVPDLERRLAAAPSKPAPGGHAAIEAQIRDEIAVMQGVMICDLRQDEHLVRLDAPEAMHEAFAAALDTWPQAGVLDKPRPWLISTARFKL
jgi:hypothetical protein